MTLIDELAKPEYAGLSDQAAADAINAKTVTVPNDTLVTMRTVMAKLSVSDARAVISTLQNAAGVDPLVAEALDQLRGNGIDLSHANAKAMVTALFLDPIRSAVMAFGVKSAPYWETFGGAPVTAAQVKEQRGA